MTIISGWKQLFDAKMRKRTNRFYMEVCANKVQRQKGNKMNLLGIDIGAMSVKSAVFDEDSLICS